MFDTDASVRLMTGYFDEFAGQEMDRLAKDVVGRVSYELHRRLLLRHIKAGDRVLEIGAGPGRFTTVLAQAGAQITVADISPVQLDLNKQTMHEHGYADAVTQWALCDVRDVTRWRRGDFDAVVAFGGPISYAFDDAAHATAGLLGLLQSGGRLLASVMSLLGSLRIYAPSLLRLYGEGAISMDDIENVWRTGDTRHQPGQVHVCRLFRAHEAAAMFEAAGATVTEMMASGWSVHHPAEVFTAVEADPQAWQRFMNIEEESCQAPGARDGGTHILIAATA